MGRGTEGQEDFLPLSKSEKGTVSEMDRLFMELDVAAGYSPLLNPVIFMQHDLESGTYEDYEEDDDEDETISIITVDGDDEEWGSESRNDEVAEADNPDNTDGQPSEGDEGSMWTGHADEDVQFNEDQ